MFNNLLPLLQMMGLGNNSNSNSNNMADMLKNMSGMSNAFQNQSGQNNNPSGGQNQDMMSLLSSMMNGGGNMGDIFKNMPNMGGGMQSMLPLMQMMMNRQHPAQQNEMPVEPPLIKDQDYHNLRPISKIANKDITYILNQYFSEN